MPSYYLHYFYAHDQVLAEQLDGVPRAAEVAEIERELLELYRDPALDREAGAARAARRRVLQRGGARAGRARSSPATAASTSSTCGTARRLQGLARRRRRRGAGAGRARRADAAAAGAARARSCSASSSTWPRTSGSLREAATSGDLALVTKALLAHPLVGQLAVAEELVERLLEAGASTCRASRDAVEAA